jgi:hypothetical protein
MPHLLQVVTLLPVLLPLCIFGWLPTACWHEFTMADSRVTQRCSAERAKERKGAPLRKEKGVTNDQSKSNEGVIRSTLSVWSKKNFKKVNSIIGSFVAACTIVPIKCWPIYFIFILQTKKRGQQKRIGEARKGSIFTPQSHRVKTKRNIKEFVKPVFSLSLSPLSLSLSLFLSPSLVVAWGVAGTNTSNLTSHCHAPMWGPVVAAVRTNLWDKKIESNIFPHRTLRHFQQSRV